MSRPLRIYVASSWRCERQSAVVQRLREAGHEVYDFKNPAPGDNGFGWRQVSEPNDLRDPFAFRDVVLKHPIAQAAFAKDMAALMAADVTVLVLPCGRSAHLEFGYATGIEQVTIVLLTDPVDEPELMYLMNSFICTSLEEVVWKLGNLRAWRSPLDR